MTRRVSLRLSVSIGTDDLKPFRSAIVSKVMSLKPVFDNAGVSTELFHSYSETKLGKQIDQEQLIQYSVGDGYGQIDAHDEGVAAVKVLLLNLGGTLFIAGRSRKFSIGWIREEC